WFHCAKTGKNNRFAEPNPTNLFHRHDENRRRDDADDGQHEKHADGEAFDELGGFGVPYDRLALDGVIPSSFAAHVGREVEALVTGWADDGERIERSGAVDGAAAIRADDVLDVDGVRVFLLPGMADG